MKNLEKFENIISEEISEDKFIIEIQKLIDEKIHRDEIHRFIMREISKDNNLLNLKYDDIENFLEKNNLDIEKKIDKLKYRNMILDEFQKNSKISKKDLSKKLESSNLKFSRISEYMNYYYDLFYQLSQISEKK